MKWMYSIGIWLLLFNGLMSGCIGQNTPPVTQTSPFKDEDKLIGGPFENREFMYIGMPKRIPSVDTSKGWYQHGQKLLITGTIFQPDGKTPAPGVILYYYHTDIHGLYASRPDLDKRVVRHGYIRGWVKSDANGQYAIYTIRPAPYPNSAIEAHIHPSIKEPGMETEYYIDEFVFDDDPLLTGAKRKKLPNRGGSGILRVLVKGELQIAEHNIILGLNIPNYPKTSEPIAGLASGLPPGTDNPSFIPFHAFGPDKGSRACPVCKYGRFQGILYFIGNHPDWTDIKKWLVFLDRESIRREQYLKTYLIYGNSTNYSKEARQEMLEKIGRELGLQKIALTFVPSLNDAESEVNLNKINPEAGNTLILYKHRNIVDKYVNLTASENNFKTITLALDRTKGNYFQLSEPAHH